MKTAEGTVRNLAKKSQPERWEICVYREQMERLPFQDGQPVDITLRLGDDEYKGLLRSTERMRKQYKRIWISEAIHTMSGEPCRLIDVLRPHGYSNKGKVTITILDDGTFVLNRL
ncbi:hypothetical protein PX52LOC_00724 [Limnoglobus roseus]|uniref:Uncharacterized protein n=1 Tax=Limnoglobus roseus TaxID=2598579 RepID=A0A5C1A7C0_9BACT|nr:hypothetical protein PX52LOC_00724 [Limnoglobus roseus]